MAVAHGRNGSKLYRTTHFGRKEDEVCTQMILIEDIKGKIRSAKPGEALDCGVLECANMDFNVKIYPNGLVNDTVGNIAIRVIVRNHGKRQWKSFEFLAGENSTGAILRTHTVMLEDLLKRNERFAKGFTQPILRHVDVLDEEDDVLAEEDNVLAEEDDVLPEEDDVLAEEDDVLEEENSSFFPDGVLTVKVNIKIHGEETVTHKTTMLPDESITASQLKGELSDHFRKLLKSPQFSNFRIICQGQIIPCHRNILAARSEIFEAMLEHKMVENQTGQVEIKDFDLETVKAVLLHIYTGEVKYKEEKAGQMLRAADYYRLHGLKKKIEDALVKAVKIENAIDMFVLGDVVHADKLRDVSKDIIVKNAVAIVETDEGWKERLGRFHDLAMEILESVLKSKAHAK